MRARMGRRRVAAAAVGMGVAIGAAPAAAAERAYELVTPADNPSRVLPGTGTSTPDGNIVCFDAETALAGASPNGEIAPDGFCSWRTASGWDTKWIAGPGVAEPRGGNGSPVYWISPGAERAVFASDKGIYPDFPGDPVGEDGTPATPSAFLWEGGGPPRWLSPTPAPDQETSSTGNRNPVAASVDLRYGLFESGLRLLPEDQNAERDVYQWTPDGIRLVSRDASGTAAGGIVTAPSDSALAQPGTMSLDGSRIFFNHVGPLLDSEPPVQNVFLLEGDDVRHISPRLGGEVPDTVTFVGSSADGDVAYLQTAERLTPEAKQPGTALYRYDVSTDELTLVATDPMGVVFLGLSADGSTLVYRTEAWDLRIARNGVESTLGPLEALDVVEHNSVGSPAFDRRALRIAPDGSAVVFHSLAQFDGTAPGVTQVFRWTPADGLRRVSAAPNGQPPVGNATIGNLSTNTGITPRTVGLANTLRGYPLLGRVITDDGRVFFETTEQLAPQDINAFVDVYEWENGAVRPISPGTQSADALYHDNSADGDTVFFTTSARLIPALDRNTSTDLYAARVGGGFPLPAVPPLCGGDGCQGPLAPPTTSQPPATSLFNGPGDADEPAPPVARHSLMRISARQRRSFARTGRTTLRVRVSVEGTVTATASTRVGRRTIRVARSTVSARRGMTARLPLTLSPRALRTLRTRKRLRLVITVSYSKSEASVRRVVVLRG